MPNDKHKANKTQSSIDNSNKSYQSVLFLLICNIWYEFPGLLLQSKKLGHFIMSVSDITDQS